MEIGRDSGSPEELVPHLIDHQVDEIWVEGNLEQRYNFIDYHFMVDERRYRARTYLDEADKVALYGPFGSDNQVLGDSFDSRVVAYLRRRFRKLERLGAGGYELL